MAMLPMEYPEVAAGADRPRLPQSEWQPSLIAKQLRYHGVVVAIEELLEGDLATSSQLACELVPDIVAALDYLVPRLASGADRTTVRRYYIFTDAAAQTLTDLPARCPQALPASIVMYGLLRRSAVELPWVAPSSDGLGALTVFVDRLRGFAAGLPQQCARARRDIDPQRFCWFLKAMAAVEHEQRIISPLRRAMTTLDLSSSGIAEIMGVKRQAVDKWLLAGPPAERMGKIGALAEISDILRYRLRDGMPPVVVRRAADAYGGRTMLEVIAEGDHEWLLQSVKDSFDYARVA